jgi:hypothetical protein
MSDEDRAEWFCPGCAEYARNLPTIQPQSPSHPTFERRLTDDPELATGYHLIRSDVNDEYGTSLGTIVQYTDGDDEYLIETNLDEPFNVTQRWIDHETLLEFLVTPDGMNPPRAKSDQLVLRLE